MTVEKNGQVALRTLLTLADLFVEFAFVRLLTAEPTGLGRCTIVDFATYTMVVC